MAFRKVAIENSTFIAPIQMEGPVLTPISISENIVFDLVRKGYRVKQRMSDGKLFRLNVTNMKNPEAAYQASKKTVVKSTPTVNKPIQRETIKEKTVEKNPKIMYAPNNDVTLAKPKVQEPVKPKAVEPMDLGMSVHHVNAAVPFDPNAFREKSSVSTKEEDKRPAVNSIQKTHEKIISSELVDKVIPNRIEKPKDIIMDASEDTNIIISKSVREVVEEVTQEITSPIEPIVEERETDGNVITDTEEEVSEMTEETANDENETEEVDNTIETSANRKKKNKKKKH